MKSYSKQRLRTHVCISDVNDIFTVHSDDSITLLLSCTFTHNLVFLILRMKGSQQSFDLSPHAASNCFFSQCLFVVLVGTHCLITN